MAPDSVLHVVAEGICATRPGVGIFNLTGPQAACCVRISSDTYAKSVTVRKSFRCLSNLYVKKKHSDFEHPPELEKPSEFL